MTNTETWTREDFLAFLTLYGANADMEISEEEKSWIKQQFGTSHYDKARQLFDRESDYENIEVILALREKFCPGEEGKMVVKSFLEQLFKVDNDYSYLEKIVLKCLEKLL